MFAGGFISLANGADYAVILVFGFPGPSSAREGCTSKDFPTGARTPMQYWVRGAWCAATFFALQAYNCSRFGEIIADFYSGKAGLGNFGCTCYALHQFAPSAHIYPKAIGPSKRFQVLVYSTFLAETVVSRCHVVQGVRAAKGFAARVCTEARLMQNADGNIGEG